MMGSGLPPLEFTDCVTDSPFFRENVHAHERELEKTNLQIKGLIKDLKDIFTAAKTLSRAQLTLSQSLQNFKFECIGNTQTDDEVVISKSLAEFGKLIEGIEEERGRMMDRTIDQIITPLENFRKTQIGGVKEGKKKFEKQTSKFCQSQERYLNLSTKKQGAFLQEADATLEMEQRHFIQASLEYVFMLQKVQERKKFEFVEILLSFMFGWLTFYHQGHEVAKDFKPYMTDLQLRIQKTRENFISTRDKTESLMKKTMEMRQTKPLDAGVSSKSFSREGYLYLMEKKAFGTTWTKQYCTYQKNSKEFSMIPYNQMVGKFNATEKMTLASCVRRMSDSIEKRFCFDVTSYDKPGVLYTLQALSDEDRKEWLDIMDGKEPTYGAPSGKSYRMEESNIVDEAGLAFITKSIDVLENRGLDEQGLYRVVGVNSKVNKLLNLVVEKKKLDKLVLEDPFEWESKTITSAIKMYLRNLPEPIMTYRFHPNFIAAAKHETYADRVNEIHHLVYKIPKPNFTILDLLMNHLHKVAAHSEKNLMTVSNLAVCFGPTLLRHEEETVAAIMDIKFCNVVVEILIQNYLKIFKTRPPNINDSPDKTHPELQRTRNSSSQVIGVSMVNQPLMKQYFETNHLGSTPTNLSGVVMESAMSRTGLLSSTYIEEGLPKHPQSPYSNSVNMGSSNFNKSASPDNLKSSSSSTGSLSSLPPHDLVGPAKSKRSNLTKQFITRQLNFQGYDCIRVRTLYACLGENEGELSFEPNQIITNVKKSIEPGWLEGTLNGKTGLVPENYVELLP